MLLSEMLGRGGLAVECAAADGIGQARLTLQPDGNTFLQCTASAGALADAVSTALIAIAGRIATASTTVKAMRTAADVLVFGITLTMAVALSAMAGAAWTEIVRPLVVFAAYSAATPLRGPLLRFLLRGALRLALRMER